MTENNDKIEEITDTQEIEELPIEVNILESDLKALQNDVKEFKDKYLRTLAETENLRKRLQKERQDIVKYAIENLVLDLLLPLDHLEGALTHTEKMSNEVKHWAMGFHMILRQFKDSLANHNVKSFSCVGETFDPHRHEAIEMIETEKYAEGTIVEECMVGYELGDRTIRPAKVKVAKKPLDKPLEESEKC